MSGRRIGTDTMHATKAIDLNSWQGDTFKVQAMRKLLVEGTLALLHSEYLVRASHIQQDIGIL